MSRPAWHGRFPTERYQRIVRMLHRGPRTCGEIAAEMEVSTKTVFRDIEFMRDRLGIQIIGTQSGMVLKSDVVLCACCSKPI